MLPLALPHTHSQPSLTPNISFPHHPPHPSPPPPLLSRYRGERDLNGATTLSLPSYPFPSHHFKQMPKKECQHRIQPPLFPSCRLPGRARPQRGHPPLLRRAGGHHGADVRLPVRCRAAPAAGARWQWRRVGCVVNGWVGVGWWWVVNGCVGWGGGGSVVLTL